MPMIDFLNLKSLMKTNEKKIDRDFDLDNEQIDIDDLKSSNFKRNKNLIIIILIPIILSGSYFYLLGRNRFFVRSDVIVRKTGGNNSRSYSLNNIISGGNQESKEDARFLKTYLESPQILEDLQKEFNFLEVYQKKGLDLYAGINRNSSREKIYNFFRKQISVSLNEISGVLRIRTFGYDPNTSFYLNSFLINQAEFFINNLNQEVYRKQLEFSYKQVEKNLDRLIKSSIELEKFQEKNKLLDTDSEATAKIKLINKLEAQLAQDNVDIRILENQFIDKNSPEIIYLRDKIAGLEYQIRKERENMVSPEGENLNQKASEISRLKSQLKFHSDLYVNALTTAEKINVDSLQRQRFMAILSKPFLPESQWNYWRHKGFFSFLFIFLTGSALTKFILGLAQSHND